jgi:phosphate transport system substrate-binding protein
MKMHHLAAAAAAALLAVCGSQGSGSGSVSQQIQIVGSSTVYPFTTAVAEQFQRDHAGMRAVVESTGTGAGIKLFCAGVGDDFPDMVDASRRIKKSEFESCAKNGVKQIIELPIGIDGLAFIQAKNAPTMSLTPRDIYAAIAATPFGKPNTAKTWHDVNPALPATRIQVYGPPPTSGTRDSLADLILDKGCETDPAMQALKKSDENRHKAVCTKVREDGAYIEAGENDNLQVQKIAQNPEAVGILGYSYLEENQDKVRGIALGGIAPTADTISGLTYPGARLLYVYVKGEHLGAIPGMREFLAEYAKAWAKGGYLDRKGLIPSPADVQAKAAQTVTDLKPITGEDLH